MEHNHNRKNKIFGSPNFYHNTALHRQINHIMDKP